jgi:phosphatidylglycerophosphate synthase
MSENRPKHGVLREAAVIGLTLSRLLLAEKVAERIKNGQNVLGHMGIFIAADIADGCIARKWGVDTPLRRIADSVTDRVSVARVGMALHERYEHSRAHLGLLAGRELVVGAANVYHYVRTGEVVHGHGAHKLGSLSVACFGAATLTGNEAITNLAGRAANIINLGLGLDYISNAVSPHGEAYGGIRHIGRG